MSLLLFSALTLLVGWYEGNSTCKKLTVGMLVVALWLELGGTNDSCSTVFRSVTKVGPGGPGTPHSTTEHNIYGICCEHANLLT